MEYWNNPKETYSQTVLPYPKDTDPIVKSLHQGEHVLFWDPGIHKNRIEYKRTVQEQCDWLNSKNIWQDPFRVATIVKLNIYIDDIKRQGVVKPMLLYYNGNEKFGIQTGENRMRATERIPKLVMLASFIQPINSMQLGSTTYHRSKTLNSLQKYVVHLLVANTLLLLLIEMHPMEFFGMNMTVIKLEQLHLVMIGVNE